MLATTNDKRLVDTAAKRPGRFDLILDIGRISSTYYLDLIRSKTDSAEVIRLFTPEILECLEARKVTGAFIVNLVKHAEIRCKLDGDELGSGFLRKAIDQMNSCFYRQPDSTREPVGFG